MVGVEAVGSPNTVFSGNLNQKEMNKMITGHNIICFGSSSWQYPGMQQTAMRLLADRNRILYVNALGSRNVSLKLSQCGFYLRRIKRLFQPNQAVSENAMVCNPLIIPFVYSNLATKLNRGLLRAQFQRLLHKINYRKYILWVGTPTAALFLDLFDPSLTIYNPVDRYYAFSFVNGDKVRTYEQIIASKADAIICTAEAIRTDLLPYNKDTFTVNHGVDIDHFHSALKSQTIPEDIANIQQPIIGFFGGLDEWVNFRLIRKVAYRYPNASVVLIGGKTTYSAQIEDIPNVHLLGYKNFNELPLYLKQFTVCLIPYIINERLIAVDPVKLREYLSMGKAVVSVDLPEVRKLENLVSIGREEEEFVEMVGRAMGENSPSLVEARIRAARQSEWPVKMAEISKIVNDAFLRKNQGN